MVHLSERRTGEEKLIYFTQTLLLISSLHLFFIPGHIPVEAAGLTSYSAEHWQN